jgi:hypothetical protein
MRAQSSLMGFPRSMGDFFTFGPALTAQCKLKLSLTGESRFFSWSEENTVDCQDWIQMNPITHMSVNGELGWKLVPIQRDGVV